ncbi:MAG TPA: hypothetical protein VEQ59_25250, partial [Polyangiaceae bacterium]|nr:hypothetical protein [Polyangiaceae bacterium]
CAWSAKLENVPIGHGAQMRSTSSLGSYATYSLGMHVRQGRQLTASPGSLSKEPLAQRSIGAAPPPPASPPAAGMPAPPLLAPPLLAPPGLAPPGLAPPALAPPELGPPAFALPAFALPAWVPGELPASPAA